MAIEVMKNSIHEPRYDKASPKVGAILVISDGSVDTASRGELRHGDHAEFTLLERKHRNKDLTGSMLFSTLEPCAPGSRNHPKLSCAERVGSSRLRYRRGNVPSLYRKRYDNGKKSRRAYLADNYSSA